MTKETGQFDVRALRPSRRYYRALVLQWLHWLASSRYSIERCQRYLVVDDYGLKLAGCRVDLSWTQVALW